MNNPAKFEELFRKELENNYFPVEKVDEDVRYYFPLILMVCSPQMLNCDVKTYSSLVDKVNADDEQLNLYEISFLLNAYAALPAREFDLKPTEYRDLINDVQEMSKVWNELVTPIRKKVENKLMTEQSLQMPKNGMSVIPGRGR